MPFKKTNIIPKEVIEYSVGEYKLQINKPGKAEVFLAFKALVGNGVGMDLLRAGEIIFDTCAVAYDSEILEDTKVFMSLCLELATEYVAPAEIEIKKK
jgi:hypothetical protein